MRYWLLYCVALVASVVFTAHREAERRWVITGGGSLTVEGSTNVNEFTCAITNYSSPDTIHVLSSSQPPVQLRGQILLDVAAFDCHNPLMTADLRKTLKSKQHPKLAIRFLTMDRYPDQIRGQNTTRGQVLIELAGVERRFEVDYRVEASSPTQLHLVGSRRVRFSDFNLQPPRKVGGMIRTNDELDVVFDLKMKVL